MAVDIAELRRLATQGVKAEIARLNALLQELEGDSPATPERGVRRKMSPEARQRIAEASRKRWAAKRAAKEEATPAPPQEDGAKGGRGGRRGRPRKKQ